MEQLAALPPFLQKAWEKENFKKLTVIQEKAIPLIREGKDVIAESPTGTGKTLAYLIPLLEKIDTENKNPQVVILASTRELVMQIGQVIQTFASGSGISSVSLIGGADMKRQIERLKKRPQLIVGTPGRVKELIDARKLKMHDVKSIVIDEADQTLQPKVQEVAQSIVKTTQKDRQLLFFSATIPPTIEQLGKEWMEEAEVVRVARKQLPKSRVDHIYVAGDRRDKIDTLRKIVKMEQGKYIVFVNDSIHLEEIEQKLTFKGTAAAILHGSAWKTERETVLNRFREGKISVLITTDVAARGLDIKDVTHVIHYDLPGDRDSYLHRSGRTGRMDNKGTVISLVTNRDIVQIQKIAKSIGVPIHSKTLYKGELTDERIKKK